MKRIELYDWLRTQSATYRFWFGMILVPILLCFLAISVLAIGFRAYGLYSQWGMNAVLCGIAMIGMVLEYRFPHFPVLAWTPSICLFLAQSVIIVIVMPMQSWHIGFPSYVYSFGVPAGALLVFRHYLLQVELRQRQVPHAHPA